MSRYCSRHRLKVAHFGHPNGRTIPREWYAEDRERVQQVIAEALKARSDHPAILTGLRIIREQMAEAMANPTASRAHEFLARVARHGVEPLDVLVEAGALYVFSCREPHALPDDDRLTWAIGTRVARLVPAEMMYERPFSKSKHRKVYRRVPRQARQGIGTALREDLAPLLANLRIAVEELAARPTRRRTALQVPIINP